MLAENPDFLKNVKKARQVGCRAAFYLQRCTGDSSALFKIKFISLAVYASGVVWVAL